MMMMMIGMFSICCYPTLSLSLSPALRSILSKGKDVGHISAWYLLYLSDREVPTTNIKSSIYSSCSYSSYTMFVVRIYLMMLRVVIFFLSFFVNCILIIIIIISLNISQRERTKKKKQKPKYIQKRERKKKWIFFWFSRFGPDSRFFFVCFASSFFFVLFYVIRSTESATEFLIFCSLFSSTSTSCVMMTTKKKSSSSLNKDDEDN